MVSGEEQLIKMISKWAAAVIFVFSLGLWVKNLDSNQAYAAAEIKSLQDENEKLHESFQEINSRLSRIEGKLDVTLRRLR